MHFEQELKIRWTESTVYPLALAPTSNRPAFSAGFVTGSALTLFFSFLTGLRMLSLD